MRRLWLAAALVGCSPDPHPATVPDQPISEVGAADGAPVDAFALEAGDASALDTLDTFDALGDSGAPDTRFASYPPWPDADVDGWLGGPADAGACEDVATDAAPGTRFCELYRDFFAHRGAAGCQTYGCHGGDRGAQGLALGWSARSAYDAMCGFKTWVAPGQLVTPAPGADSNPLSALANALGAKNGYFMPYVVDELGNRKLTDAEVARVEAWLARGAPFD